MWLYRNRQLFLLLHCVIAAAAVAATTTTTAAALAIGRTEAASIAPIMATGSASMPVPVTATITSTTIGDGVTGGVAAGGGARADKATLADDDCRLNRVDMSLFCRGSRALRNVIHNLSKSDKPIVLFRGLEIVPTAATSQQRVDKLNEVNGDVASGERATFLGSFAEYLRTHELNVKFSDLLADESAPFVARDGEGGYAEARKKDKGQGLVLAMAMMFAKMMAMLGLGGIGALAMKALGVAMMALVMAAMVGLKSLSQHGGGESSHSVSYVTGEGHHHKRRRRSVTSDAQLAYAGWPYATPAMATAATRAA